MLHITAELGKPGRRELERKHYPSLFNQPGPCQYKAQGRKFIDHGYCFMDDTLWRPHNVALAEEYTNSGPDWESQLRYIPHPSNESQRFPENENWPDPWFRLRTYPGHNRPSDKEWTAYPEGYHWGKICVFGGIHKASSHTRKEVQYNDIMGNCKKEGLIDKRNGIWIASPGDKTYKTPEYCPGFHKVGSTRPVVNFGDGAKKSIVPMQPLPAIPVEPYTVKERRRRLLEEASIVASLEEWRPATPLVPDVRPK